MNPYVRSDLLKCENASPTDVSPARCALPNKYAGAAASAIDAANDQRNLYMKEMGHQYWFNSAAGLGIIGLSADAIYKGVATSSTHAVTAEAAGIAGIYGADAWLHNKSTEAAYVVGFQAITCTLLRTRAILLPQSEFDDFGREIERFENQIKTVDGTLSDLQIAWDFGEEAGETLEQGEKTNLNRETRNAENALARARKLLLTARSYESEINTSGATIRNQVDLIVASVSSQLAQSEPSISTLKGLVGTFSDPSKGIAALQAVPLSPSGTVATTPAFSSQSGSGTTSTKGATPTQEEAAQSKAAPQHPEEYKQRQDLRKTLWEQVSELYALGRPLNAVLTNSQNFYASTKSISACEFGGPPALEITPATVADPVLAGTTLKFAISGGIGIPEVSLTGSTGSSADAKTPDLALSVNGNSVIATVTILPDASGTLTLQASDKGQPAQQAKVTIDVEKSAAAAKPTFKATPGDRKIDLTFSTPTAKGGTLTGYTVTLSSGTPATTVTLKFASSKAGTKATGSATISGEISADSGGSATIELGGLTNGQSYSVGLTATFTGAPDVVFEALSGVKPAAPKPATKPKPKAKTSAPARTSGE